MYDGAYLREKLTAKKLLTVIAKCYMIDIWKGPDYASANYVSRWRIVLCHLFYTEICFRNDYERLRVTAADSINFQ